MSAEEAAPYLNGTKYHLVAGSSKGVYMVYDLNNKDSKNQPVKVGELWYPESSYGKWAASQKGQGAYAFGT